MSKPNWVNRTIWTGDNLPIMRGLNSESIDLIYLDPPFNSKTDYAAPIGRQAAGAHFKDTWSLSEIDENWLYLLKGKTENQPLWRVIQAALTNSDKSYLIFMAVRLLEMRRLLKATGSIYLHCDATMSHSLKLLMDAIFEKQNFRNDLLWRRTHAAKAGSSNPYQKRYGTLTDNILFYARSADTQASIPKYFPTDFEAEFKHMDERGKYRIHCLVASAGMHKSPIFEWNGLNPKYGWLYNREGMDRLASEGRIHYNSKGTPLRKEYLTEYTGRPYGNLWTDIPIALGKERTGYPTQKPIALLKRLIIASSKEGDMVLDPFCGSATTLVAAEDEHRKWVGIDIGEVVAALVKARIRDNFNLYPDITVRIDQPQRTDLGSIPRYNSKENKERLYGEQHGCCNGCDKWFEYVNMTIDHIIARNVGGTDHIENLQLLCGHCNSVKGDRGQEYLITRLAGGRPVDRIDQSVTPSK